MTNQAGRIDADPQGLPDLAKLPHVVASAPMLDSEGMLQSPGQLTGVSVQGIDPAKWPKDDILHSQMLGDASIPCRLATTASCWGRGWHVASMSPSAIRFV